MINSTNQCAGAGAGNTVAATYTFPSQGLYMITLSIKQDGTLMHQFMQSQRVSRGTITNETTSSSPLWAGAAH